MIIVDAIVHGWRVGGKEQPREYGTELDTGPSMFREAVADSSCEIPCIDFDPAQLWCRFIAACFLQWVNEWLLKTVMIGFSL
jgi:hypothetical protein